MDLKLIIGAGVVGAAIAAAVSGNKKEDEPSDTVGGRLFYRRGGSNER